jgi:hypothetical protein
MIELTGTAEQMRLRLNNTTIGTCDYIADNFPLTSEVLHTVKAVNGIKLQWVTPLNEFSLITAEEIALAKIAELRPEPPRPEPSEPVEELPPIGVAW